MSINYTTYISQISNLMVITSTDANFQTMVPGMIDYAEQRMYRDLDLQNTRVSDTTVSLSSGNSFVTLPTDQYIIVVEQLNVLSSSPSGTRTPLTPTTKEYIDFAWPTSTATGVPIYCAPLNDTTFKVGPAPDQPYPLEVVGTIRPAPLSASNSSTWLTQHLPDMFIAASMVFASGYMRNYGAQADDPQMPGSWESQYNKLLVSAGTEEFRKKFQSQGWSPMTPNPVATPPRT